MTDIDTSKTLEELDGIDWGEPTYRSNLVIECHRLRRVPLRDFTVEDLCTMIGQDIGAELLVPVALTHLAADPFVERDFYPGFLIEAVLTLPERFWANHPRLRQQVSAVVATALAQLSDDSASPGDDVLGHTKDALRRFVTHSA